MASVPHAFAEQATVQTTTNTTFTDITGAALSSASFTAGKKYLIVVQSSLRIGTAGATGNIKTVHGTTEFPESEFLFRSILANDAHSYLWFTVWEAVSGEGIKLQFKVNNSAWTIGANTITLFALQLTDYLTENTDWFFAEHATDGSITSGIDGASITFTPASATDDWLLMTYAQTDVGQTTQRPMSYLMIDGDTVSDNRKVGWRSGNISTIHVLPMITTAQLSVASHTIKEHSITAGGVAGDTRLHSAVFALNLSKFKTHAVSTPATTALGTTNYGTQLASASLTPSEAGDVWCGGYTKFDRNNASRFGEFRLQVDNADAPGNQTTPNWQFKAGDLANDECPISFQTVESLTAAAHTVDLDGSTDLTTGVPDGDFGFTWAVELALPDVVTGLPMFIGSGLGRIIGG